MISGPQTPATSDCIVAEDWFVRCESAAPKTNQAKVVQAMMTSDDIRWMSFMTVVLVRGLAVEVRALIEDLDFRPFVPAEVFPQRDF